MEPPDQDRLWEQIKSEAGLERLRDSTLAAGMTASRRRRNLRRLVASGAAVCALLLIGLVLLHDREFWAARPEPTMPVHLSPSEPDGVTIISDEQLLGLFRDRTPALVGEPGNQRLVLSEPK